MKLIWKIAVRRVKQVPNQPHQCRLSDYDRRTLKDGFRVGELVSVQGVDYFENLCLQSEYIVNDFPSSLFLKYPLHYFHGFG